MAVEAKLTSLDPTPLLQMANGYWASQVLHVAVQLNVFTKLSSKNMTVREISDSFQIPLNPAERFLNACCALGLLKKENGAYRNTALVEQYLVEHKDGYLGYFIILMKNLYGRWEGLLEALQKKKSLKSRFADGIHMPDEDARMFTLAMHSSSSLSAPFLVKSVDLSGKKRLLDIGGGSGANSIALTEAYPGLEAVVFDFPPVIKVAKECIDASQAADRVTTMAGDYTIDALPDGCDCILLSHILHGEGAQGGRMLLKKCYDALKPGGKIVIVDFLLNENKDGPVFPALFSLNMLIETPEGDVFTAQEMRSFLEERGFVVENTKTFDKVPAAVVSAIKP